MRRALCCSIALGLLGACTHDLSAMFSAETKTREADALLAAADIEGARAAYRKILVDHPGAPNALFGAALTDLMLIGTSAPAVELADVCHQPALDIAGIVFGPDGIIAQAVLAREGDATLSVHYFSEPGAAASDLVFRPTDVRARIVEPTRSDPRRTLYLSLRERDAVNSRWLTLDVNTDDIAQGDEEVTPLIAGAEVELSKLAGALSMFDFSRSGAEFGTPSGKLRFTKVGRTPSEALEVELVDVRLPAPTLETCGGDCGPAWYTLSGKISDRLSPLLDLDPTKVPFAEVMADDAEPVRAEEVVAAEGCSPVDDRFVALRVRALGELMAADAELLAALLDSPDRDAFSFEIPSRLFRSPANLPVNLTDARALRGMLLTLGAMLEIVAEYRWLAGDLQAQIEEHAWAFDDEPFTGRARVFWPTTLAMNLETGFFTRPEGFDLSTARGHLRDGLSALHVALGERPERPGLLDFAARPSARLVNELAVLTGAMASSIDAAEPVALSVAPLYSVHLAHFFEDPLDASRIRQLMGLLRLWEAHPGDLEGPSAAARNPEIGFTLDVTDVRGWTDGVVRYPPIDSGVTCDERTSCAAGYTCNGDRCELSPPWYATEEAWRTSTRLDWPAFVSNVVRDALAVDL